MKMHNIKNKKIKFIKYYIRNMNRDKWENKFIHKDIIED